MTELKLVFKCGECNGYMSLECYSNDTLIFDTEIKNSDLTVTALVDFPFDLKIKVSGKNPNTDTLVEDGKIVKDKYIELKQIYLARYPVNVSVLHRLCQFIPDSKPIEPTTFFYCNGQALLKFQSSDALKWHLMYNKYYDLRQKDNLC